MRVLEQEVLSVTLRVYIQIQHTMLELTPQIARAQGMASLDHLLLYRFLREVMEQKNFHT